MKPTTISPSRRRRSARLSDEREDGHDLRRRRDHEPGLARGPVVAAAEAGRDLAQRAIVHVHRARPQDLLGIDPQLVAEVQVRIDQRGQQVVRRRDGVKVAVEMQVDLVERRQRRLAAAGRAAFLAEDGPERRLAQRRHGAVAALHQPLRQANGGDRLALAARGRRDGGDEHQLAARFLKALEQFEPDFCGEPAVRLEQVQWECARRSAMAAIGSMTVEFYLQPFRRTAVYYQDCLGIDGRGINMPRNPADFLPGTLESLILKTLTRGADARLCRGAMD